jgi:mycoredoxin
MGDIRVLGTTWCGDCTRSKTFLDANNVNYQWTDIEQDQSAFDEVVRLNGRRVVPTIIFEDGTFLTEPSDEELGRKLGLN